VAERNLAALVVPVRSIHSVYALVVEAEGVCARGVLWTRDLAVGNVELGRRGRRLVRLAVLVLGARPLPLPVRRRRWWVHCPLWGGGIRAQLARRRPLVRLEAVHVACAFAEAAKRAVAVARVVAEHLGRERHVLVAEGKAFGECRAMVSQAQSDRPGVAG
jgi:hypothetical protein